MIKMRIHRIVMISLIASALLVISGNIITPCIAIKYGGTLVMALAGEPATLNSAITTAWPDQGVGCQILSSLVDYGWDFSIQPELAQSWEISPDGLTYTFHLVTNATWHDGEPFTSADVKFSLLEVVGKYHPSGAVSMGAVDTIETPNDYTVVVHMLERRSAFLITLAHQWCSIVPKHLYEGTDILTNPYNSKPIGTGPFMFLEWVRGEQITLVKNPNFWREGRPYIDKVVYKFIPDPTTRALAVERHEVDSADWLAPTDVVTLQEVSGLITSSNGTQALAPVAMLMMNVRSEPLTDVKVRRALSHATNKEAIVKLAFFGLSHTEDSFISKDLQTFHNPDVPQYEHDVEKANMLLDEAGYPKGGDGIRFTVELCTQATKLDVCKAAEVIRDQWKEIGVEVVCLPLDSVTYIEKVYTKADFDMCIGTITCGPDPWGAAGRAILTDTITYTPFSNCAGYSNPEVDELWEKAGTAATVEEAVPHYFEAQRIVMEDAPVLPLYQWVIFQSHWSEWHNLPSGIGGGIRSPFDKVWWEKGSDISSEGAMAAIESAEQELERLKSMFYDVSDAMKKLDEAKNALEAKDYLEAFNLADESVKLAKPPYLIYAGVIVVIVIVIASAIYVYRKRKR